MTNDVHRAIGIIAEYNPFHNGHIYHMKKIKEKYSDYTLVLVMNGNFTQRGEVTIIDKWKRSKIALEAGIDLIVELPFPFATQSADFFAYGGITLLENLKVEKVIFGSECNNIKDLEDIVNAQLYNEEFNTLVHIYSKQGNNYPTALSLALSDITGKAIETPNDLLGISYIKTIKENNYHIIPETIKRTNDYHDEEIKEISSATAIRKALKGNVDIDNSVPQYSLKYLNDLHFIDDYFPYLKYKILTESNLNSYQTVTEGIENLLKKSIVDSNTYTELIDKIKSKRYTHNKIMRMLLHILVGFTKEDAKNMSKITYIRLLGFSKKGKQYLNTLKKDIKIPILSKISKNKDKMLEFEIETTKIYEINSRNLSEKIAEEYKNHLNIF